MRQTRGSASSAALPRLLVADGPRPARARTSPDRSSARDPPRLTRTISATARGPSSRDALLDRLRVLARQLPLATRSSCRPRSRGRGSGAAASSCRPPRRSRRPSSAPGPSPGAAPTAARAACRGASGRTSRTSFRCVVGGARARAELRLRGEAVAEAVERGDAGCRSCGASSRAAAGRVDRELEVDRRSSQSAIRSLSRGDGSRRRRTRAPTCPRRRRARTRRRRTPGGSGASFSSTRAARRAGRDRGGTPRVLQQVGHRVPPLRG